MRYMGSKARHAAAIMPILMRDHDPDKWYVEPFVGGGNMIASCPARLRHGNDTATYAVTLLEALSQGWTPPTELSEDQYQAIRRDPHSYDPALAGFAMYCCSYAGKAWGGYARGNDERGSPRNFAAEQARHLLKQARGLRGVWWTNQSYLDMTAPDDATVYCDPPYAGTTGYKGEFDHGQFWVWTADLAKRCRVFVSEYTAPEGLCDVVWTKTVTNSLTKDTGAKSGVEMLFRVRP